MSRALVGSDWWDGTMGLEWGIEIGHCGTIWAQFWLVEARDVGFWAGSSWNNSESLHTYLWRLYEQGWGR